MINRKKLATKMIIVAILFPLLAGLFSQGFRVLALMVREAQGLDLTETNSLVSLIEYGGLIGGLVGAYLVCRRIWPRGERVLEEA